MTKVEVELISDVDMHSFFKKGMRGIVSYISKRYSIVNYKYDPKQESKHLINQKFVDCEMSKFPPTDGLKWIVKKTNPKNVFLE